MSAGLWSETQFDPTVGFDEHKSGTRLIYESDSIRRYGAYYYRYFSHIDTIIIKSFCVDENIPIV